ncbi:MAG: glycosyltransferase family 4 protein [Nitrospinales bacterium]
MKIFYLSRINVGVEDAGTRHVWEFCRHFSQLGHDITLFVPEMGHERSLDGVSIVKIPSPLKKSFVTFFSFYFILAFFFIYHCIKKRPDVVYTRHQPMEWMTIWLKLIFNLVYVAEVNGLAPVEMKINQFPSWYIFITRCMEKLCFVFTDLIVTPSSLIKDSLQSNYRISTNHFLVVTNGADPEISHPMDKISCREKFGLDDSGKYLIFVGSLKNWHGIEKIIEIMPELKNRIKGIKLLVVGDGEKRESIESLVSQLNLREDVLLTGRVPFEEVPFYINSADICLAPYFDPKIDETGISPLKIYEYMACAKPIISNPVGGLDKLFEDHEIGVLVHSRDAHDWVEPISNLLNDPEKMKIYGANGRAATLEEFSWNAVCMKIETRLKEHLQT